MEEHASKYILVNNMQRLLGVLAKVYAKKGSIVLQKLIENSRMVVDEAVFYDGWNGGQTGHDLHLFIPEEIYLECFDERENIQTKIVEDINKIKNIYGEHVNGVYLEMETLGSGNREDKKMAGPVSTRMISDEIIERIWDINKYRLFISHKAEFKKEASEFKNEIATYGVSCFVAHQDIVPTTEWQNEIEHALFSMDALVAFMTDDFHNSYWTDQEVGCAIGRGVPIISVKLGIDPYGFIGKFQALSCLWRDVPTEVAKLLIKYPDMINSYIKSVDSCGSFDDGNKISRLLPYIQHLSNEQVDKLILSYNVNYEVQNSFGFNGKKPSIFGSGLASHLERITGVAYKVTSINTIEKV